LLSSNPDQQPTSAALMYIDVKLEAIMPRVCHISLFTVLMKSSSVGGFSGCMQIMCSQQVTKQIS
jgi:hypothetical protein